MKLVEITAVSRAEVYSPHCESNDAMIFKAACVAVERKGFDVKIVSEENTKAIENSSSNIYMNMARGKSALECLERKERCGAKVVNSAASILCYNRAELTRKLISERAPMPESEVFGTQISPKMDYPFWVKRGDECSQVAEDINFVTCDKELEKVKRDFQNRNIASAVVSKHVAGDLVKFYGVGNTDFFYTFFPTENGGRGKFGLEKVNGEPHHYKFDVDAMRRECHRISQELSIPVYGGDCVVSQDGDFKIIDFNDWPSFSKCRDKAAEAIASLFC